MMKYWTICLLLILAVGCNQERKDETNGAACLKLAREALLRGECDAALRAIDSLRKNFPMALNAREAGIVLKDSIEIESATQRLWIVEQEQQKSGLTQKEIDSLQYEYDDALQRIKFYRHKLKHDLANMKIHK